MSEAAITSDLFRRACGLWATGVSIVTTVDAGGRPYGLTMNAVTSLSLTPPMFIVCVDRGSDTLKPMQESRVFCVNVLTAEQQALSNRFAKKGEDKFDAVEYTAGVTGAPVIAGSLVSIECAVNALVPGGDHWIFCGDVRDLAVNTDPRARPLLYFGGRYAALGTD
jgi:flavin reductase (DIM6/NTAB) family NADH-FMN oxidoreductase RutF